MWKPVFFTWQLAAEDLQPHADASGRPPLWEYSDVLGHQLLESPHLRSIVVAVSFKNLKAVSREGDVSLSLWSPRMLLNVFVLMHFEAHVIKNNMTYYFFFFTIVQR